MSTSHLFISITWSQAKGGNNFLEQLHTSFNEILPLKEMVKETIAQLKVIVYTPVCNLILFTHTNCHFIRDFPSNMTKAKVLKPFKKRIVAWFSKVVILPSILYSFAAEIWKKLDEKVCPI